MYLIKNVLSKQGRDLFKDIIIFLTHQKTLLNTIILITFYVPLLHLSPWKPFLHPFLQIPVMWLQSCFCLQRPHFMLQFIPYVFNIQSEIEITYFYVCILTYTLALMKHFDINVLTVQFRKKCRTVKENIFF